MALQTSVFTSPARTIGGTEQTYSPTSSTLVTGERDAVLIDAQFITDEVAALGELIERSGKRLSAIYVTHAHADHCLGLAALIDRFPGARAFATQPVVDTLAATLSDQVALYRSWFADDVAGPAIVPSALTGGVIDLEGEELRIVEIGQGDIPDSTVVHIPSIDTVVAGDVVYNKIHLMLALCTDELMGRWIESLDAIERLGPRTVIAGHRQLDADDSDIATVIDGTRSYIRDFRAAVKASTSAKELVATLAERYPDYGNLTTLLTSARAHFPRAGQSPVAAAARASGVAPRSETREQQIERTRAEVTAWFFEDYLPRWVAVANGTSGEGPEFIHGYWGTPMHVTALDQAFWCLGDDAVLSFLELNHASLRDTGYDHTVVPDRRVIVYNPVGAAIEVIWSRRRADESEVQRWASHFELGKSERGWRIIGVQSTATDKATLAEAWAEKETIRG
jgi:glyoxylase-like metal-dependent hydrolase (beta-lactamase superfamily II)